MLVLFLASDAAGLFYVSGTTNNPRQQIVACYEQNSEQSEHDTEIVALEEAANLVRDNSRTSGAAEHSHCAMRLTICFQTLLPLCGSRGIHFVRAP
jgi:hypothetical protein